MEEEGTYGPVLDEAAPPRRINRNAAIPVPSAPPAASVLVAETHGRTFSRAVRIAKAECQCDVLIVAGVNRSCIPIAGERSIGQRGLADASTPLTH